jgi:hypothetical protein
MDSARKEHRMFIGESPPRIQVSNFDFLAARQGDPRERFVHADGVSKPRASLIAFNGASFS